MEQVPNIAMFLHESRPNFPAAFSRYLVPIVVRYLTDPNNQVCLKLLFVKMAMQYFLFGVHLPGALFLSFFFQEIRDVEK